MVQKHVPATADAAMETDPDWTTEQRMQQQADEDYIQNWYERQRRRNQQHRWNQRERMWQAWERLGMLRNDMDVCRRSAEGKKIAPKKQPQPASPRGPAKCAKTLQFEDNPVSLNPTASSSVAPSVAMSPVVQVNLMMHDLGMPHVDQIQGPLALPWIEKKFPQPRTMMLNRVMPKLGPYNMSPPSDKPPYGQVLIDEYRKWQNHQQGGK